MHASRYLMVVILLAGAGSSEAFAQPTWNSPHLKITEVEPWSEGLDVLNQPHLDLTIQNDGTEAIGSLDFTCRQHALDRATPLFEGASSTTLEQVIRPGENRVVRLIPNIFGELGRAIQGPSRNTTWSCYVSGILTAAGQRIGFEPGQLPTEGPPFGVAYMPTPDAMAPLFKVRPGVGMMVAKVQRGSAAEASGVQIGDVILAIDGREMNFITDLPEAIGAARRAGRAPRLAIIRAGQPVELVGMVPIGAGLSPTGLGAPGRAVEGR